MNIAISYSSQLRRATGTSAEDLCLTDAPHTTLDIIHLLFARHRGLARYAFTADGTAVALLAFLNDEQINFASPPVVHDRDTLTLLTPISGGTDDGYTLTPADLATYEWQLNIPGFGPEAQLKLKRATVLISRVGGVGSAVALYLAAAGVGRLILAHAGNLKTADLNRQILQTADHVGRPRIDAVTRRLLALNPALHIEPVAENLSDANAPALVARADLVIDAAPLFAERFAMNRAAVGHRKPLIEAAMFDFDAQLLTILPGRTACLACLYPADPPAWRRQFPVLGAVAGVIGSLAAVEAIKLLTGLHGGPTLAGHLLACDLATLTFRKLKTCRNPVCQTCGNLV